MTVEELIALIKKQPDKVEFDQVIDCIDNNYEYNPTHFTNGQGHDLVNNLAGSNEGSCKIFAFAQLHQLTPAQTLACFGAIYREEVLRNPGGNDHQNIRNFMKDGWAGITFNGTALS